MMAVRRLLVRYYPIPLLLGLWQLAGWAGLITTRLLPTPWDILRAFATDIGNDVLVRHTLVTMGRVLAGFTLGAAAGVALAAAMARFALFRRLIEPLFVFGYPVPKIALFPIFAFIFGFGSGSKIAFTALECLYPVAVTSLLGMRAINMRLFWVAASFGAGPWTIFRRVLLPASMPSIMAGLRIALPLAIIVVVLTEMIGDSAGLGYYINIWSTRFRFANVYAGILMIGLCGFVFDAVMQAASRIVLHWQPRELVH